MNIFRFFFFLTLIPVLLSCALPKENVGRVREFLFRTASDLNTPICKSHEAFQKLFLEKPFERRWVLAATQMVSYGTLAIVTTFPGIALRSFATHLDPEPFLNFKEGSIPDKVLPKDKTVTLFSWNICCVGAGYPITDGGVAPWESRIDGVVKKVLQVDADVTCLYETFDGKSAFYLHEKLKENGYTHFYLEIGPKALGVSSGIFVASKYELSSPEFLSFSKETLVGRTKYAEKGVFSFDVRSEGKELVRVFATHLQHSEEPEFPTKEEKIARAEQMAQVISAMEKVEDKTVLLTGDLNLNDQEYEESAWNVFFDKGKRDKNSIKTWGGDAFCAQLMHKRISSPLNLDYTMLFKNRGDRLKTSVIDVGFDSSVFQESALSDHAGLLSVLILI